MIIIALVILNIPLYIGLGWVMFHDWSGFWDAVKYWLTPDIISLFKGQWGEDMWQEMKLGLFILLCILCVAGEFQLIHRLFLK